MSLYDFATFKNSSFGESVVYTPSGGSPATIKAVVFRREPRPLTSPVRSDIQVQVFNYRVMVDRNDVATVTENADKVEMKDMTGTTKTFRVQKILASDEGCYTLGVA